MWKIFRDREDQTKGFETQTADPKIDNEVLKGALVAGQHFKGLTVGYTRGYHVATVRR